MEHSLLDERLKLENPRRAQLLPLVSPLASGCLTFFPSRRPCTHHQIGQPTERRLLAAERAPRPAAPIKILSPFAFSDAASRSPWPPFPLPSLELEPSPQWVAIRRMSKTCHEIDGAEKTLDDDEEEEEAGS